MSTISTHALSINLAKEYITKDVWIALGGSSITWVDNNNPPTPSLSINNFDDLTGLLYIDIKRLVSKNPTGPIKTEDSNYLYADYSLATVNLIERQAYYLYLEGTAEAGSVLDGQRITLIGIAENVVFSEDVIRKKYSFIPANKILNYDLTLVSAIPELVISSERKFQFVRRF